MERRQKLNEEREDSAAKKEGKEKGKGDGGVLDRAISGGPVTQ